MAGSANLERFRERRSADLSKRTEAAIRGLIKDGERLSFAAVAARVGCSTDYLYSHKEFRPRIERLRSQQRAGGTQHHDSTANGAEDRPASQSSIVRTLTTELANARCMHREEVGELKRALAQAHGELLVLRRRCGLKASDIDTEDSAA
jgi:hypothetical protein